MSGRIFQKRQEDFGCEQCGAIVMGDGYTNHCPKCLYSKHVDVNPGDRANMCLGLMKPIGIAQEHGENIILHKCLNCGIVRRNKSVKEDDLDQIINVSNNSNNT